MKKVTFDFSAIPDLGVSEEGGSVVSHPTTLGLTTVSLGDDDVLRVNSVSVMLYIQYRQSSNAGDNPLTVADLEANILGRMVASGSLAQVLFENMFLIPRHWWGNLIHQSAIFWGTETKTISGEKAYPTLGLIEMEREKYAPVRSVINVGRCIYLRPTVLLTG